jgi:hypothetical protein
MKKIIVFLFILLFATSSLAMAACAEELPKNLQAWSVNGAVVKDGVVQARKNKTGYIFTKNDEYDDNILEFMIKVVSDGEAGVYFSSSGVENGYIAVLDSVKKTLTVYELTDNERRELAVKPCNINLNEWYNFKVEIKGPNVKIYVNDNKIISSPLEKIQLTVNNKANKLGILLGKGIAMIKDVSLRINDEVQENPMSYYINPVDYAAEPNVIEHKSVYYMYANNAEGLGIDVYTSYDLVGWNLRGSALKLGDAQGYEDFGYPSVTYKNGKFYMIYTADEHLGIAVSESPTGPFVQQVKSYMSENSNEKDGFLFFDDDNTPYLYFTRVVDGKEKLYGTMLNSNMLTYKTETLKLLAESASSPYMVKRNNKYYLLFTTDEPNKTIKYSVLSQPLGDLGDINTAVMAVSASKGWTSPSIVYSPSKNEQFLIYQSCDSNAVFLDRIRFEQSTKGYDLLNVLGPTVQKQAVPDGVVRFIYLGDKNADERTKKNNLLYAINYGAQNMIGTLDYENNYLSVWEMPITAEENYARTINNWHGHNIGRWIDSCMRGSRLPETK